MSNGVYIHIPFCRSKCDYCSFYSIPLNNKSSDNNIAGLYVETLCREFDYISGLHNKSHIDTIYFGGGTPSILEPVQIDRIIKRISERFIIDSSIEITLEMNPDDLIAEKLDGFTQAGVNRIVLGVQSLNEKMRGRIGRRGPVINESQFDLFFNHGTFTRCIDIMAGLPGQSKLQLIEDLQKVTLYKPQHISLYLLSVDEDTPLGRRFIPDETFDTLQADLWGEAMDFLKEQGYVHYEISNYALPGFESRHNSKYWDFTPYYGFGSGAHSFVDGKRSFNKLSVQDYIKNPEFIYEVETPTIDNIKVEFFLTAIRRIEGFSEDEFRAVTKEQFPDSVKAKLNILIHEGMIEKTNGKYHLSKKGIYYTDSVIYQLTEQFI